MSEDQQHSDAEQRALDGIRNGRWRRALRAADDATAEGSGAPWLHRLRGVAQLHEHGPAAALPTLREAVAQEPHLLLPRRDLVCALLCDGDTAAASATVASMESDAPEHPVTLRTAALVEMSLGNWNAAEKLLRTALDDDPEDVEARTNLGVALTARRRVVAALLEMQRGQTEALRSVHWRDIERNRRILTALPGMRQRLADTRRASTPAEPGTTTAAAIRRHREARRNAGDPWNRPFAVFGAGLVLGPVLFFAIVLVLATLHAPTGVALLAGFGGSVAGVAIYNAVRPAPRLSAIPAVCGISVTVDRAAARDEDAEAPPARA